MASVCNKDNRAQQGQAETNNTQTGCNDVQHHACSGLKESRVSDPLESVLSNIVFTNN